MNVSRETKGSLEIYAALLAKWNKSINLVAPSTIPNLWERHIEDSLQLIPFLPESPSLLLDIGSGAGLPGVVLSLCTPHQVTMIDSDTKKCLFLNEVKRHTAASFTVICARIEKTNHVPYDVITSRACASLPTLVRFSKPFLKEKSYCLFHKGKNYIKEVEEARKEWYFDLEIYPSCTDNDAAILKLSNIESRD
jgi:16S rRNA (guanine527-N7)-methyltransferase